jgi:hypothetical protein
MVLLKEVYRLLARERSFGKEEKEWDEGDDFF